jgi:malonyl CoA-acyl carrier protein transacylase
MVFVAPAVPVIANVTAQSYPASNASDFIKSMLVSQITQPVHWTQTIQYLASRGVRDFRELGPGNVLARLIQQIQPKLRNLAAPIRTAAVTHAGDGR